MKASVVAKEAGVTVDTVRYYTRTGLLRPNKSPGNGYHMYSYADLQRLRFIRQAKSLGFSLADIRQILSIAERGESPCPQVRAILSARLTKARQEILQSLSMYAAMLEALERWNTMPDGTPDKHVICHLIESCGAPETPGSLETWLPLIKELSYAKQDKVNA